MGILNAVLTVTVSGLRSYRRDQPLFSTFRNVDVVMNNEVAKLTEQEIARKLEEHASDSNKLNAAMSVVQGVIAAAINPNSRLTVWDGVKAATAVIVYDVTDCSTVSAAITTAARMGEGAEFEVGGTKVETSQIAAFAAAVLHPWLVNAVTGGRYSMEEVYCVDNQLEAVELQPEDEDHQRRLEEAYAALGLEREMRELAEMERDNAQSANQHPQTIVIHVHTNDGGN
jgi:hypothetical protein